MAGDLGEARGKIVLDVDDGQVTAAEGRMAKFGQTGQNVAGGFVKSGGLIPVLNQVGIAASLAGAAVVAGFGLAVKTAIDFEKQLSAVQAVSGATEEQMVAVSDAALRIGKDTVFSASEAGLAMEELVKAGIPVEAVLNGAADAAVALAAAGGVDLATAATIAANAMNQFNIAAEDLGSVADTVAGAVNASAIDMHQFQLSMSQAGAVANLVGSSFEDTSTAIALLGNAGIVGSDAGTSLKQVFLNLIPVTDRQKDKMKELGLMTAEGANQFFNAAGELKSMAEVSELLQNATAGLTSEQRQMALETIFGSDAIRGAAILAQAGAEGFDKMSTAIAGISAADVAATRLDNMSGKIENLRGNVETAQIMIGNLLIPILSDLSDIVIRAVSWFTELDAGFQRNIVIAGLLSGVLLIIVGVVATVLGAFLQLRNGLLLATGAQTIFSTANGIGAGAMLAQAAAARILSVAMKAIPIVAIIALIVGLVAAFVEAQGGMEGVVAMFKPMMDRLVEAFQPLMPVIDQISKLIGDTFSKVITALLPIFDILIAVLEPVLMIIGLLAPVVGALLSALMPLITLLVEMNPLWDILAFVLGIVADALTIASDAIQDFFKQGSDGTSSATTAWEQFSGFIMQVLTNIGAFFQAVGEALYAWFVQPIVNAINTIIAVFTFLQATSAAIWAAIMAVITPVVLWFQTHVGPLIEAVIGLIVAIFQYLGSVVAFVWEQIVAGITSAVNFVSSIIATVWGAIIGFVAPIFQGIYDFISGIFTAIFGFVSGIVTSVNSFISDVWNTLVGIVMGIFTNVFNAIKEPLSDVMGFFKGLYDDIVGFFSDAGEWLVNIGGMIIGGLIRGIEGALGGLTSLLGDITNMIPESKGPARVDKMLLFENGQLIMQSLVGGLQSEVGNLLGMLGGLNVTIPASLDGALGGMINGGRGGDSRSFTYNAAPGTPQVDGEEEMLLALKRSKVLVPGWS